ncbi:corticotropin-releasing factor receptor 1 isoform X9 [Epinephelus fuscoguttatus]|uniref:corticotropin-releasing factor receptor 1 isoform X9 n=1 Tax=Epinephelus fuscoguttatus TaxID=293821 RepID=UPI0020CFF14F|nr:corticotropin-releasing factor receptor 1 isoform X9 [Epinephelus fuscoguttatus]
MENLLSQVICACVLLSGHVAPAELTCETLILLSTNLTARALAFLNQTFTISNISGVYCDLSVDGIGTCWPRSAAGELISRPCPEQFNGIHYNTTNRVYRECQSNGSWAPRGNYSQCTEIIILRKTKVHYQVAVIINYLGHCISLGALLLAFTLFMRLRSIRCLRNIIHWNLISAFILRNATWFIVQLTMNPAVTESNQVWCRLVTAGYNYFHVTNFFWMFGEGCYLHTAVVLTYSTDKLRKWMFICIGWGIPFPIIVAWAFGKLYYDNEKCWFGKKAGVYTDYIYQGPMILVLLINFVFLFNIVRILMTKLRASTTSETIQYRYEVRHVTHHPEQVRGQTHQRPEQVRGQTHHRPSRTGTRSDTSQTIQNRYEVRHVTDHPEQVRGQTRHRPSRTGTRSDTSQTIQNRYEVKTHQRPEQVRGQTPHRPSRTGTRSDTSQSLWRRSGEPGYSGYLTLKTLYCQCQYQRQIRRLPGEPDLCP